MKGTQNIYDLIVKIYVSYAGQWTFVKNLPAKLSLLVTYASILQEGKSKKKTTPNTITKNKKKTKFIS